ncbi:MAG: hypothetical protein M3004_01850 [Bacteroidota bacterium]|nr:hypothetical protein [Bacteroidota bacterium]
MRKIIILLLTSFVFTLNAQSQGCVLVHNISGLGPYNLTYNTATPEWQLNITNRYFKSVRNYIETIDQKTPKQNQPNIESFSTTISVNRNMKNGWSFNLGVPISSNSFTSSLEHGGPNTKRHTLHSFGVGDIRFTAYKWLLPPAVTRGNIQLGLGIKFPTGDYKYQDYYYRNDSTKILSTAVPSVQLGDGGTGIVTELNFFYDLNNKGNIKLYGNFHYLLNPREQTGVSLTAGHIPSRIDSLAGNIIVSVPDQFSLRFGAMASVSHWTFSAGIRNEGEPVHDLIGGSEGIRRAGHYFSIEPGINYTFKNISIYAYVPVIVARRIKQTVPDQNKTRITGVYTMSTGTSANYLVFAGLAFKL